MYSVFYGSWTINSNFKILLITFEILHDLCCLRFRQQEGSFICVSGGVVYLSFGETLPSVRALRQQGVQELHPLSQWRQQHGRPHRQSVNHCLMGQTHTHTVTASGDVTDSELVDILRNYCLNVLYANQKKNKMFFQGNMKGTAQR